MSREYILYPRIFPKTKGKPKHNLTDNMWSPASRSLRLSASNLSAHWNKKQCYSENKNKKQKLYNIYKYKVYHIIKTICLRRNMKIQTIVKRKKVSQHKQIDLEIPHQESFLEFVPRYKSRDTNWKFICYNQRLETL